ncbi:MAG: hypothetical protein MPEBLZ_02887 [Candidatus Methanoperedens nitroreducens]|uniref:Uncharacterized protein n=1 Tax=Candidatus Methanoperedens nitratireducens TaxID=1392998 RepID=A0A0P8DXU5_9EURY|nr:hypothetical protein [Candidatus Methanoperedens sp. BLZ2]KAB2945778.1 MAG: hypothetical protein F9K14_09910 [Candidatus Methanoperedens sp.]KPQ42541.1 MAG: hypothetical protein MPEBLZ_02887 [Candidatus Methanoperedens sp. BLZ1]MBZ0174264.1 hypothetical protein [Candidatus Methanoperedens nitroreducens]CAG0986944.1 hypothetical protein METP2_02332 [Methanosarcinales archaeon]MCX9077315.1 hypothetical protein [Candidatus Methanoperedens sp.]
MIKTPVQKIPSYRYLFSWDEIPGNDNIKFVEYLKKNFGIDWVRPEEIEKINNGRTVTVSTEKNRLELLLNDESNKVNLIINDFRTSEFIVKVETGKLNIYIDRISQGDIYKDIEYIDSITEENGIIEIKKIIFPYVIVLTQDCDLNQDFTFRAVESSTDDKLIISVLVAPIYNVEHLFGGEHLSQLGLTMQTINKYKKGTKLTTDAKNLFENITPRYHYLDFEFDANMAPSVIDFKHYFSINVNYLYKIRKTNFVCKIPELHREDISHRFASFLSRIGLPD